MSIACLICAISIHASAKEATQLHDHLPAYSIISIHASAKEATHCKLWLRHLRINFNPRFREGSDPPAPHTCAKPLLISIHASAKEATLHPWKFPSSEAFQSTLPRRKRHYIAVFLALFVNFNPRFREGSD